jgi:peptidoglycan/xylan/chitin deacetylase (PgdA/CDA1 family)
VKARRADLLVLCYHAISERWSAMLSVTPGQLERQLEWIVRRGYRGATFSEAIGFPAPASKTVVITFDDAFRSVKELAFPVLHRLGFPGTVYAPTQYVEAGAPLAWPGTEHWLGGPHEEQLAPMSWSELEHLADAGWEVGSHTRTHPRLTELDDHALADELAGSREECERALGRPCRSVSYPYGDHDERVIAAAGQAGYETGGAITDQIQPGQLLRWPRVGIYNHDGDLSFRVKIIPAVRRVRAKHAWLPVLRRGG